MIVIIDIENLYNSFLAVLFQDDEIKTSEHSVKFICLGPKLFCIPYDYTFNVLKEKVCRTFGRPTNSSINTLYYHRPTMNVDNNITYKALQIVTDEDVLQILNYKSQFRIKMIIKLYVT